MQSVSVIAFYPCINCPVFSCSRTFLEMQQLEFILQATKWRVIVKHETMSLKSLFSYEAKTWRPAQTESHLVLKPVEQISVSITQTPGDLTNSLSLCVCLFLLRGIQRLTGIVPLPAVAFGLFVKTCWDDPTPHNHLRNPTEAQRSSLMDL